MKRITFTVGIGTAAGKELGMKPLEAIRTARQQLAIVFSGFTETEHFGGWYDDETMKVVYEPSLDFMVVVPEGSTAATAANVNSMAVWLRDLFQQSCVLVTDEIL